MRKFFSALGAVLVCAQASLTNADSCPSPTSVGGNPHTVNYQHSNSLEPGTTFFIDGWDQEFVMVAIPFAEFGVSSASKTSVPTWALHIPKPIGGNADEQVYANINVGHSLGENCNDFAVFGEEPVTRSIGVSHSKSYVARSRQQSEYNVRYHGWPSIDWLNTFEVTSSYDLGLQFRNNDTYVSWFYRLNSTPSTRTQWNGGPNNGGPNYYTTVGVRNESTEFLTEECADLEEGWNFAVDPITLTNFQYGPTVVDAGCTYEVERRYDYRGFIHPDQHYEDYTDMLRRLDALVDYVYLERLSPEQTGLVEIDMGEEDSSSVFANLIRLLSNLRGG